MKTHDGYHKGNQVHVQAYLDDLNADPMFPINHPNGYFMTNWLSQPIELEDGQFACEKPSDELLLYHMLKGVPPEDYEAEKVKKEKKIEDFRDKNVKNKLTKVDKITRKSEPEDGDPAKFSTRIKKKLKAVKKVKKVKKAKKLKTKTKN